MANATLSMNSHRQNAFRIGPKRHATIVTDKHSTPTSGPEPFPLSPPNNSNTANTRTPLRKADSTGSELSGLESAYNNVKWAVSKSEYSLSSEVKENIFKPSPSLGRRPIRMAAGAPTGATALKRADYNRLSKGASRPVPPSPDRQPPHPHRPSYQRPTLPCPAAVALAAKSEKNNCKVMDQDSLIPPEHPPSRSSTVTLEESSLENLPECDVLWAVTQKGRVHRRPAPATGPSSPEKAPLPLTQPNPNLVKSPPPAGTGVNTNAQTTATNQTPSQESMYKAQQKESAGTENLGAKIGDEGGKSLRPNAQVENERSKPESRNSRMSAISSSQQSITGRGGGVAGANNRSRRKQQFRAGGYRSFDRRNKQGSVSLTTSPRRRNCNCCSCPCACHKDIFSVGSAQHILMSKLAIGRPAPDFKGQAVVDGEFKEVKLTDYKGKYLVFFFYPLDFTFVCPTEIIAFSDRIDEFRRLNCEVVACSTDSQYSHFAWVNTPRKEGGLGEMKIPLLSDSTHQISKDYGVLKEDEGCAFRGLFVIDDRQNLRQITINEIPIGRDIDETLRLVQAYQYFDKNGEVCPANWRPGRETFKPGMKESRKYFSKQ